MLTGTAILLLVFFGFIWFFRFCDDFSKSDRNPNRGTLKGIVGSIVALKAAEIITKSRGEKHSGAGRSVVDDINAQSRR